MPRVIGLTERFKILARDNFRCVYCGATPQSSNLHIDHVMPRSKGGADSIDNYVTACFACNVGKSDLLLSEIMGRTEFENSEWRCTVEGLEHKGNGYYIAKERLNEIAEYIGKWCSDWLVHMAGKYGEIPTYNKFVEAFYQAFLISGTPMRFDWNRSVERGRKKILRAQEWSTEFDKRRKQKYGDNVPEFFTAGDLALMNDFRSGV